MSKRYARFFRNSSLGYSGGTPVIQGTRIPVYDVAASVTAGLPMRRILSAYPGLDEEKVGLAVLYAEANLQRAG